MLHYHLVMVIKYRNKVIDDKISSRLREIFEYIAPRYNITLEEWKICLLNAPHFLVIEPIRHLLLLEFIYQLGIELGVVDRGFIVNELPVWDLYAQIATASCDITEWMLVIGSGQEGSETGTVFLSFPEDRASVHFDS